MTTHSDIRALIESHRELARSGISAADFYRRVRNDGVTKLNGFVLLRDLFNLNLMECDQLDRAFAENQNTGQY